MDLHSFLAIDRGRTLQNLARSGGKNWSLITIISLIICICDDAHWWRISFRFLLYLKIICGGKHIGPFLGFETFCLKQPCSKKGYYTFDTPLWPVLFIFVLLKLNTNNRDMHQNVEHLVWMYSVCDCTTCRIN